MYDYCSGDNYGVSNDFYLFDYVDLADYTVNAGYRADYGNTRMGTSMAAIDFNYRSMRSEKARIGVLIRDHWIRILPILTLLLLVAGISLVVISFAAGWVLIGFSFIPAMISEWYKGELYHLKSADKPKTIDDILSGEILGRLSRSPNPLELVNIISRIPGGQFFGARFGVGNRFLQELVSNNATDMPAIWDDAFRIYSKTGSHNISAAAMVVALAKSIPGYQNLLSRLQLDETDLMAGVYWYNHLRKLIETSRIPRRSGGIARDWSFGYTPLISQFGQNISQQIGRQSSVDLVAHDESLARLIATFGKGGRQNAVLVGPSGVGKTQIIRAFAEKLMDAKSDIPESLRFRQVIMLDASRLIASASGRGDIEQLVDMILGEAYQAKNMIVCLDNAQLFFEEGVGSVDITNLLIPILQAGRLRMILTMDEQRYLQITKRNSELANTLNRINIAPATKAETIKVMQEQSIYIELNHHVTYMYQALEEAYRLSERYIYELAMPGRALRLLESSADFAEDGLVTAESVRKTIEKTTDVKVGVASGDDEREKLLNLESLIHERMINQTRAVGVVSDALRRARAGVRNQSRPIGTFLFLGPTGVGKTELAKALAEIYFGGENKIIRMDMNEFVSQDDVMRLIADGADDAGSLTAQIMKQPFSVILLDEIEKAHPAVLTTLLQLLDEGILRDVRNREVSFRDAIIIGTSNAGADRIREYIERGYDVQQFEKQFVDELIDSHQFKSEFLNRFDEIVMFRPLNHSELLQVVDLILVEVNRTLALQKISVNVAQEAKEYLVEAGYDPRLGARPMRRVVQKAVENTVAKQVLSNQVEAGGTVEISLEQVKNIVDSKFQADEIGGESVELKDR